MKLASAVAVLGLLLLTACGGGSKDMKSRPAGKIIDPSGNWNMTLSAGGQQVKLAAMFSQVGVVVSANSFTAAGNPEPFNCVPFSATLANGLVTGDQFTGAVTITHARNFPGDLTSVAETFTFAGTLTPDGEAVSSGTYSNLPACTGIAPNGSFAGGQVPSVSGGWSGTLQPCTQNQDGSCTPTSGTTSTPFAATLTQNDANGQTTGSYNVSNLADFTTGTVEIAPGGQDILSGFVWQFTMNDSSGAKWVANGLLAQDRSFTGNVGARPVSARPPDDRHFLLIMRH